jgi:ubiquinone biosynthesis protein COQ9
MAKSTRKTVSGAKPEHILRAILAKVPEFGWTDAAYEAGLKAARIAHAEADKRGLSNIRDVIQLFGDETDRAMETRIKANRGFSRLRVREKVAFAVRARLEFWALHKDAVKRLMFWYAMPLHAPEALKRLYKTVDAIWVAAGDTSEDYNFYTKRLLLAAVIKATVLFWLSDESEDHEATWAFLDRRINDVVRAGKAISLAKEWEFSEIVDVVRTKFNRA